MARVDLGHGEIPVGELIREHAPLKDPLDLMVDGVVIARLVAPSELSDAETRRILDEGWAMIDTARSRTRDVPSAQLQLEVRKAVRAVREGKSDGSC